LVHRLSISLFFAPMQRLVGMLACQSVGVPSDMLAHAALGKRKLGKILWTSRANERNVRHSQL
jgi:hypothetical protein